MRLRGLVKQSLSSRGVKRRGDPEAGLPHFAPLRSQ